MGNRHIKHKNEAKGGISKGVTGRGRRSLKPGKHRRQKSHKVRESTHQENARLTYLAICRGTLK